jgi:hypothetical protein
MTICRKKQSGKVGPAALPLYLSHLLFGTAALSPSQQSEAVA